MTVEKALPLAVGIVVTILGSLVAYVFYGFINLSAEVKAMRPVIEQMEGEQKDLWNKYNDDDKDKVVFITNYYESRLKSEVRWTEFYKEKSK